MRYVFVTVLVGLAVLGCREKEAAPKKELVTSLKPSAPASRPILVDGSTTVEPLTRGILDLYASQLTSDVELKAAGTGAGFKKFCRKQSHVSGASRPINSLERKLCESEGVSFVELPVAFDAIAVVVPRENEFLRSLKKSDLEKIWSRTSESSLSRWNDVNPRFPKEKLALFGPSIDNGTLDFFSEVLTSGSDGIRSDYSASSRPEGVAEGVSKAKFGLGFLSFAHYLKHESELRAIAIDDENDQNGAGPIEPSRTTIADGTYQPFSRPLFLYVSVRELSRPEVLAFIEFYLRSARLVAPDVGHAPLPKNLFSLAQRRLQERRAGSIFSGGESALGLTIEDLLAAEALDVGPAPTQTGANASRTTETKDK